METNDRSDSCDDVPWWKEAVIYQIYPRSFNDSDCVGHRLFIEFAIPLAVRVQDSVQTFLLESVEILKDMVDISHAEITRAAFHTSRFSYGNK